MRHRLVALHPKPFVVRQRGAKQLRCSGAVAFAASRQQRLGVKTPCIGQLQLRRQRLSQADRCPEMLLRGRPPAASGSGHSGQGLE